MAKQLGSAVKNSAYLLFSLAYHTRQALTTQSDLTLAKGTEACVRFDMGQKIHLAETDSANAARALFCWKCDSPSTSHVTAPMLGCQGSYCQA